MSWRRSTGRTSVSASAYHRRFRPATSAWPSRSKPSRTISQARSVRRTQARRPGAAPSEPRIFRCALIARVGIAWCMASIICSSPSTPVAFPLAGAVRSVRQTCAPPGRTNGLTERLYSGLSAPEDQGMNILSPLVGIHDLEIDQMPDHAKFVGDAVAAQHIARHARDFQRLAAGIALEQ